MTAGAAYRGPRVLSVLLDFPLPANTGLHLRMASVLSALRTADVDSRVLWFSTADRSVDSVDDGALDELCCGHRHAGQRVEQHELGLALRAASKLTFAAAPFVAPMVERIGSRRPFVHPFSMRYDAAGARERIVEEIERLAADAVVVPSQGIHWLSAVPHTVMKIVDAADVLTDVSHRLASEAAGASAVGLWANHLACRTLERRYLPAADEVWVSSAAEASRVVELAPGSKPLVVPNVVAAPGERTGSDGPDHPRAVGMIATWSYKPNLDAALRLIDEVAPVLHRRTGARLILAGADLPADLRGKCRQSPAVEYMGRVEHLHDFYSAVDAVVMPISVRGGVPLKLAEALAWGVPIVATSAVVCGLDLQHGRHLLVADSNDEFAESAAVLLADRQLASHLAEQGRAAHQSMFSHEALQHAMSSSPVLGRLSAARVR
ncbi:MAG: glycosyltransferase [Acidimicrobiales bacterium]